MLLLENEGPLEPDAWSAWVEDLDLAGMLESAEFFHPESTVISADESLDITSVHYSPAAYAIIFANDAENAARIAASYEGVAQGAQITLLGIRNQNYDPEAFDDTNEPDNEITSDEDDEGFVR
jgi:hypothetical protein